MGLAVLIDRGGYRVTADRGVLKSRELGVVHDIAQAFALAEAHVAETLDAHRDACARREREGYDDGMARAARDATERLVVAEFDRSALLASLRPALADLVVDAIVLMAKGVDRQALYAQALESLHGSMRDSRWARLRVHPDAVPAAQAALDAFALESVGGGIARVVADDTLALDGCVFESEFGKVDAGLQTQLDTIRGAIGKAAQAVVHAAER